MARFGNEVKEKIEQKTENYDKISKIAGNVADITGGIPVVGGITQSVAAGISLMSKNAASSIQKKNPNKDNWYFVLPSSDFFERVQKIIEKIMSDDELQSNYKLKFENYNIDMYDDFFQRIDNEESTEEIDISYFISIKFNDDSYSYKEVKNATCSIMIEFREKFKQINFQTNMVYSAFEIISHGSSPSEKRKYSDLSSEIVIRLCNNLY